MQEIEILVNGQFKDLLLNRLNKNKKRVSMYRDSHQKLKTTLSISITDIHSRCLLISCQSAIYLATS
ncbi:MAG: hypothetical protein ACJAZM_001030 [Cyclobacteriaceae bacterium]|jgi:hypothetical protein